MNYIQEKEAVINIYLQKKSSTWQIWSMSKGRWLPLHWNLIDETGRNLVSFANKKDAMDYCRKHTDRWNLVITDPRKGGKNE